jgi:glycosyltransferase involved in cell wall biosynthesis
VRIAYVLPYPELNGGNKVVFQHVALLRDSGHELSVLAQGPRPDWIEIDADYQDVSAAAPRLATQDLVIATYWTTVAEARALDAGPVAHFCQGYEGGLEHLAAHLAAIEAVYALPLPTFTVSPHLQELLAARFGRESAVVPPPLDPLFRPAWRRRPRRRRPWVALPGIFGAPVKGVATGLAAVERLRRDGHDCRLLRLSVLPFSAEERRLLAADRYLAGVPPRAVAEALRGCDLLLLPSRAEEGFGLPLLEAMSAGVPAVASRIPSTVHLANGALPLVPPDDAEAFAAAAAALLADPAAWRRARRAGAERARAYAPAAVAPLLDRAVRWAAAVSRRDERSP